MNKKTILLALISLVFLPAIKSGAAMIACPACASVCFFPLNPLCLACILEMCVAAPVLTACFSSDTTIYKIEDGQIKETSINELKVNDLVLANNEKKLTKVVRNIKNEGIFDYTQIILESGKTLTVTNEHGVIILDNKFSKKIIKANNLKKGQMLITLQGPRIIKDVKYLSIKNKYILETQDGTVMANNIYVSTICDDMIDEKMNSDDLIKYWKEKHSYLYNKIINN
jgi:intein/homing endonuclease